MILSILKKQLLVGLGLAVLAESAFAGQAITKSVDIPAGVTSGISNYPFTGRFGRRPATTVAGLGATDEPRVHPRQYKTVSDGTYTFIAGGVDEPLVKDGWIARVDGLGVTNWSRTMRQLVDVYAPSSGSKYADIFGTNSTRTFLVNDVIFSSGKLYVCGQTYEGSVYAAPFAYVARITVEGVIESFTTIRADEGSERSCRAMALCSRLLDGSTRIGVTGDFEGTSLIVKGPLSTGFDGLIGRMDGFSRRDVFALSLRDDLEATGWGTTLGFNTANDFASAVEFDGEGNLIVGMTFQNPDGVNPSLVLSNIDDSRLSMEQSTSGSSNALIDESGFPDDYNFAPGNWSTLVKIRRMGHGSAGPSKITHHSEPTRQESGESDSASAFTGLKEDGGVLYATGIWKGVLRPSNSVHGVLGYWNSNGGVSSAKYDVFVARMDPADLKWNTMVYLNSSQDDYVNHLVVQGSDLYVAGSAGGTLTHSTPTTNYNTTNVVLPGSSVRHNFWTKLSKTDLSKTWYIIPYEDSQRAIGMSSSQLDSSLGFAGQNVLLFSLNHHFSAIPITYGNATNFKTTPWEPGVVYGMVGLGGDWIEEVNLTVNSPYGNPVPFRGTQTRAIGQTIRFSVEPIIYEDASGTILDANNPTLIKNSAVSRRICTGYTVRNSTINGTASVVELNLTGNMEVSFLWRTEHALEVKTNLPVGLTSEAAGLPNPEVNKHWITEDSPVIAQIDGASVTDQSGVRYRSTGYIPTGPGVPVGGTTGTLVPWASFQNRQQVPQFTLTAPATIIWQWEKELSLRISSIPAAAAGAATAAAGATTATGDGEFWFAPGASITLTSPPVRDAGRLTLQSYMNGTGSVTPSTQTASAGVLSKTITLNTPSSLTWNYGKTPVPQRVTLGDALVWTGLPAAILNTQPLAIVVVSDAPPGTTGVNGIAWEPLGRRVLPLRPGKYLLEFNDPILDAASANSEDNVVVELTAGFQGDTVPGTALTFGPAADAAVYQTYIASSPSVALDSSATDTVAWRSSYALGNSTIEGLALAGGNAAVNNARFVASEPGTSVLVFTQAAVGTVGRGSLETESLFLRVIRTRLWNDPAVLTTAPAIVGTAIIPPGSHDEVALGHSGFVLTTRARYNVSLHDNSTLLGPIFPVNTQFTGKDDDKLVVAWFNRDGRLSTNWPSRSVDYAVTWPTITPRIVIASRLGSEGLAGTAAGGLAQTQFTPPRYTNLAIYAQNDATLPGYNPNEEHALITTSFLDASRNAVFALQNSLNVTTLDDKFTSLPNVLVQYSETIAAVTTQKMAVYAVEWEDAAVTDARLPAYNQAYTPKYQAEAGKILTPPWPLPVLYGVAGWPAENVIANQDPAQRSAWQDRKKQWWAASGDTDAATEVDAEFHYALNEGFWHATKVIGDRLPLGNGSHVFFNTIWPATIPVLKNGETITHSGGEAFSDGATTNGLPSVVGMASAEIIYDHANRPFTPASMANAWVARVANPIAGQEVDLPLATLPDELKPAAGNVIVDGLLWRFKGVHAGLQKRLYYDSQRGKLGFRGYLNGRTTGDRELTAAPPAINLLQPNIMTAAEKTVVAAVSGNATWTAAVDSLYTLTRDPVEKLGTRFTVGLAGVAPAYTQPSQLGTGLAVISNPDLADPAKMTSVGSDGYVTVAENNHASLGDAPIALHVIRVDRTQKYRGAIAPVYPENVFDEKITLRHNADFGGNVDALVFQWYYREEDGTSANPPGVAFPNPPGAPAVGRWTLFGEITGGNEISLSGASAALLADNLFFCRWRHTNEAAADASYAQWAGAANSRPPVLSSPSVATDAAYVAQLAEGWIKRVTNAVNPFDARIKDFRSTDAPSTNVSMLQQAGGRWEGNVAFNPSKDAIENYGLIELYQTVLNRGADLSINLQPGTSGVNTALLNAANRIATLYSMLGHEAATDAVDPTIGFGTQSGQYGNLAPSIFAFQNQTGSLLEEELALLRGRGEVGARPAYNRLLWNFTNGQGEAAYAMNYGLTDVNNDGFIDANDAARLYPQSHGDAWGHFTMALKGYANLFRHARFAWDARSEKYQINGVVFDVDYLDERTFAETAAARAKVGADIVDLVYRQKYTDNPAGQWQGYQDTNTDRAWGVYESAQRGATGAFYDWVTANALLPAKDETKDGITRVDRTTVPALKELAGNTTLIQSKLDQADNALNPLGLDADAVPFDIDPVRTDRASVNPATHFEQIYERAAGSTQNAVRAFDYANQLGQQLRRTAGSAEELRQQTIDQDREYRNRLIEILGTPYQGQIGTGKAYPAGYSGPDLFLFMYADNTEIDKTTVPVTPSDTKINLAGLLKLTTDTNPFVAGDQGLPDYAKSQVSNWFPTDYNKNVLDFGGSPYYEFTVPVRTKGYAFKAPADWGVRASPGKAQAALAEMLQAEYNMLMATEGYEGFIDDFNRKMRVFTAKTGLAAQDINLVNSKLQSVQTLHRWSAGLNTAALLTSHFREGVEGLAEGSKEALPTSLSDFTAPIRGAIKISGAAFAIISRLIQFGTESAAIFTDTAATNTELDLTIAQTPLPYQAEVIDMLDDLESHINTEPDWRLGIFQASERLRSAGDRYRATLQEGLRLVEEREAFNKRVASRTTKQRYEDYTFRIARNEALGKYRTSFDLAARYAWLAGKAYAYELNLPDNHPANAAPLISNIMRTRTLGRIDNGEPVLGNGGLAEHLAVLKTNFNVFKGQLGFNAPANQTISFSLRTELARIGLSSRVNVDWRSQLETYRVADLWNYSYSRDGVDYGQVFRRYCRPFAPEAAGPQAALVIPFGSTITSGQNWFGKTLTGGDSSFTASNFATKVRSAGVKFESYNSTALAVTPQVYLVPIGLDRMYLPESTDLEWRSWRVLDQRIPVPLAVTPSQLADPSWHPFTGSTSGYFEEARRYPAFRAYHDAGGYSNAEMLASSRLVGRSVWNTQWVLIIPTAALLADPPAGAYPGDADAGLDTFIYGAPLTGFTHAAAGTTNRDGNGVRDIRLLFQTYSLSGN
jgi:hypothetical protein